MKNWKIGTRISAGFAAVIAIAMILGIFAYSQIGTIHRSSTAVTADSLPSIYTIGQIQDNSEAVFNLELQHITSTDKDEMARLETELQEVRTRNTALFAAYEKMLTNDKDRELLGILSAARTSFNAATDEILKVSRVGTAASNKEAMEMANRQKPLHRKYLEAAANLVAFNKSNADESSRVVENAVSTASVGIVAGIGTALLFAVFIALFVVRSITRPLATAVSLVEQVSQGDLGHRADVNSTDELGRMLAAMNGMVDRLNGTAHMAATIAEGDLTVEAKALSEKDVLGQALIRMLGNLRKTVAEVASAADNVASGSEEMSSTAQQLSQGATEQAAAAEESTSSMEEMASSIQQNADNARQTDKMASKAAEDAQIERRCRGPNGGGHETGGGKDRPDRRNRPKDRLTGFERGCGSGPGRRARQRLCGGRVGSAETRRTQPDGGCRDQPAQYRRRPNCGGSRTVTREAGARYPEDGRVGA